MNPEEFTAQRRDVQSAVRTRLDGGAGRPDLLYHYTDAATVIGLVQDQQFWLTDIRFLNDAKEMEIAREWALSNSKALLHQLKAGGLNDQFLDSYDAFFTDLANKNSTAQKSTYYIACFCEDGDDISLWRSYGAGGEGYCIEFDAMQIEHLLDATIVKVIYGRSNFDETLKTLLSGYATLLQTVDPASIEEVAANLQDYLYEDFQTICGRFKHSKFASEKEYRIICERASNDDVRYRTKGNYFIPYIGASLNGTTQRAQNLEKYVRMIRAGPRRYRSLAVSGLSGLLQSSGAPGIKITASDIPYRSLA